MRPQDLIAEKQGGHAHNPKEIQAFIQAVSRREVPEDQIAAWLMAVFFRGMSEAETAALTFAMWKSGKSLPRSSGCLAIDKHSTGGVGDKTSMLLVPLVMAASERLWGKGKVRIPMVSGRALGHTGGTLDKLESVPGFRTSLTWEEAIEQLEKHGFFMMGQTAEMAPADRILYSLRDATNTVESLPLIVSSILSKKLSEGLTGLVFDVKIGTGAFLNESGLGQKLAETLVAVALREGLDARAVLTRMDEPLGRTAGNLLEMEECLQFLEGQNQAADLLEVTLALGTQMLLLAAPTRLTPEQAQAALTQDLESGNAVAYFERMLTSQGGDMTQFRKNCLSLRGEMKMTAIAAPKSGYLSQLEARAVGQAVHHLGGGRSHKDHKIDNSVGIEILKKVGDAVQSGEEVVRIIHRPDTDLAEVTAILESAVKVSETRVPRTAWVLGLISKDGLTLSKPTQPKGLLSDAPHVETR